MISMCENYEETVEWNPYLKARVFLSDSFIIYSIFHYDRSQTTLFMGKKLKMHWINIHN